MAKCLVYAKTFLIMHTIHKQSWRWISHLARHGPRNAKVINGDGSNLTSCR